MLQMSVNTYYCVSGTCVVGGGDFWPTCPLGQSQNKIKYLDLN